MNDSSITYVPFYLPLSVVSLI